MSPATWWGDFDLEPGETLGWRLGELDLRIRSDVREWQVQRLVTAHPPQEPRDWLLDREVELLADDTETIDRFVFEHDSSRLRVTPALADRPVVTSPRVSTHVLPGQSTTLFVGSPIWARVEVQDPPTTILEVPIQRASDTWFGPSRLEGELCYASTSLAVQNLGKLTLRAIRAVTPLRVENRAATPLRIERIKLPVGSLSLYASENGVLWTNEVTMGREADGETVSLDFSADPPTAGGRLAQIQEPRSPEEPGLLVRAFRGLFQGRSAGE